MASDILGCTAKDVQFEKENAFGDTYRNYNDSARQAVVSETYRKMREGQTVDFVSRMQEEWLRFDKGEYTVMEVIQMLDSLVDDSDPDVDIPSSVHDFQTAERIREAWPEHDWMQVVGLLHDLGKFMALRSVPQWAVVGDTFPVGCAFSEKCVFPEHFAKNPDQDHPVYSTEYGIYEPGCGLEQLVMSWGHDEYMYQVLVKNGCTLPKEGLNMVRFHSFYPWHTGGAYEHLLAPEDEETLRWVTELNRFDFYSEGDKLPDIAALRPHYQALLEKYGLGGKLRW